MREEPIWRKLPPVDVVAIEMAIGRHHIQIHGIPDSREFWVQEFALAQQLLTFHK
jgi:hypothetical protein